MFKILKSDIDLTYDLWRIRRTVMQMCRDRNFLINQSELNQSFEEFIEIFGKTPSEMKPKRSDLNFIVNCIDDPTEQMYVWFNDNLKIGIVAMKQYYEKMQTENIFKAILIGRSYPTGQCRSVLHDMSMMTPAYYVDFFLEDELYYNITEHSYVPEHIALTPDEKYELLNRYKLKETQLMRIQANDPIVRYYGFKKGQVVKIIRMSESAGKYISYRYIV